MNKIASVIMFDVGCRKLSTSDDSFFARSKKCLYQIIMRKMFAEDNDDVGVVLFGSDISENSLVDKDEKYSNVRELCRFGKPNFKMLEEVEKITQCKGYISDWVISVVVALEYLKNGMKKNRYKLRQLVIFSEFPTCLDYKDSFLRTIADCLKKLKVKLTVVGPDMDMDDDIPDNLQLLCKLFEFVDEPLSISLDELADSIKYFEKKRKGKRIFNVELEIGSQIKIPVGWVKLTSESQRFSNWVQRPTEAQSVRNDQTNEESSQPEIQQNTNMELDDDDFEVSSFASISSKDDVFKVTKFGQTEVIFSAADLNALRRESGLPSFKILFFTPKSQVNPSMYIGEDIFAVMPREGSSYSQVKLYALIDAMIEKNRVAIARRIVMRNGKVQLGVLIPFSDESGKHLYFLKLPSAEWTQPFPRLRGYPKIEPKLKETCKKLVDSMRLSEDVFEGNSVLVPNPHFQLRCHLFSQRAANPSSDLNDIPEYINRIVEPSPKLNENIKDVLKELTDKFPLLNSKVRQDATKARAAARSTKRDKRSFGKQSSANGDTKPSTVSNVDQGSVSLTETTTSVKKEVGSSTLSSEDEDNEELKEFHSFIDQLADNIDVKDEFTETLS